MQENVPTFATDSTAAELYTLNISGVTGVVKVSTVIVEAMLVKILYDHKPVVVYGVSGVLLPTFLTLIFLLYYVLLLLTLFSYYVMEVIILVLIFFISNII
jgi:hypothetical protein